MGACFFVVKKDGDGYTPVFKVPGVDIAGILDTTADGWHDIRFGGMNGEAIPAATRPTVRPPDREPRRAASAMPMS